MPPLSCAGRLNLYALLTERPPYSMAEGVQRLAHMRPEGCLGVLNPFEEPIVSRVDGVLEVVGRASEAVSAPSARSIAEDAPELPQTIPPGVC